MTKYIFTRDLPPTNCKKGDVVDTHKHGKAMFATWLALGYIEEVKEEEEWPTVGDEYYSVYEDFRGVCVVAKEIYDDSEIDRNRKKVGNTHRTPSKALLAKDRVERAYKGL